MKSTCGPRLRRCSSPRESYTVYDSAAKQRAEQAKFEDDLAKAKKSN